jgi:thymidylate kinase
MTVIVAFEGAEYSGKTVTAKLLAERLSASGFSACYNTGTIHKASAIDDLQRLARDANHRQRELLYTATFLLDKARDDQLPSNCILIQDRYWPSVVAYGRFLNGERSLHADLDKNELFIQPAAVIRLCCSFEEKQQRQSVRQKKTELDKFLMEDAARMSSLEQEIDRVLSGLPSVKTIDTTNTPIADVLRQAEEFLIERRVVSYAHAR